MTTQIRQQNGISILKPSGQMKKSENEMPRTRSKIDQHFNPTLLKHFRKQKYRTQGDFAAVLGVSLTTITNWETGKRKPTHKHLMKITEVLEIETSDLLCETGEMIFRLWEGHLLDYLLAPPDRLIETKRTVETEKGVTTTKEIRRNVKLTTQEAIRITEKMGYFQHREDPKDEYNVHDMLGRMDYGNSDEP